MKPGQRIKIFKDWENLRNFEGEGILIRKIKNGLPFILEEYPKLITYKGQYWLVSLNGQDVRRWVRMVAAIGRPIGMREPEIIPIVKDSFIKINGREVY